jgi:hypothetical protein
MSRPRTTFAAVARSWSLMILIACVVSGCMGYRVGPLHQSNYRSVAVPMFQNKTLMPQLEAQVTNAVIKRFQSDGMLEVRAMEQADIVVTGLIVDYERVALRSLKLDTGTTREYRVRITAEISVRESSTGKLVIEKQKYTGSAETFIGEDQQSAEFQVLPLVADDLARQIVHALTESW